MITEEFLENTIKEFIQRVSCDPRIQKEADFAQKKDSYNRNKWIRENPEKFKIHLKKYSRTEKGKYTSSKRNSKRRKYLKAACEDILWEERIQIGRFYKNCPKGYEVDHIIPISRGGSHRLSNLQYLTKLENASKGNRLPGEVGGIEQLKRMSKQIDEYLRENS